MGRNWAITIGINGYRNLQRLNYAKHDAETMQAFFQRELQVKTVYHFTDDSPPIAPDSGPPLDSSPTYAALRRFFRVRFDEAFLRAGDNLWCFFAGHGKRHHDRDYLMPIDADPGDVEGTGIALQYVTERLRRSGADNVVLLIDACRSCGRQRDGTGFGQEKQQGVITLLSCSPWEAAYEIEDLQHGAFTYALLEALDLEGEGNCATVERLYHRLRQRVPQLTQHYHRVQQTPYGVVEPPTKYHLILLPRKANLSDITTLKNDALQAEVRKQDFKLAKQLWTRVLAVLPADGEAIEAIERLAQRNPESELLKPQPPTPISPRGQASASTQPPFHDRSTAAKLLEVATLPISRRRLMQAGLGGVGLAGLSLARSLVQPPDPRITLRTFDFDVVTVNSQGKQSQPAQRKQARFYAEDLGSGVKLEMVEIPGGSFQMGSPSSEAARSDDEGPQRGITVQPFFMARYEVTQTQWRVVAALLKINRDLDPDPSRFKGANRPVERVSWDDAVEFCARLSRKTGRTYRLPSEAEWEYACRAGTKTPFYFGETITTALANYRGTDWEYQGRSYSGSYGAGPKGTYREQTTDVGSFPPNGFGLYDLHGNVWEWCEDDWHDSYKGAPGDGSAWVESDRKNTDRVLRGGSWFFNPGDCRSACRNLGSRDFILSLIGFRVCCVAEDGFLALQPFSRFYQCSGKLSWLPGDTL